MGPLAQLVEDFSRSLTVAVFGAPVLGAVITPGVLVGGVIFAVVLSSISIYRATQALGNETRHKASADARLDSTKATLQKARALGQSNE